MRPEIEVRGVGAQWSTHGEPVLEEEDAMINPGFISPGRGGGGGGGGLVRV